jgi:nucleoid-associated protein YgaU
MANERESRRNFLRTVMVSAVAAATPMSFLEAATQEGPALFVLEDGTELEITKEGEVYKAVQKSKGKVISEQPSGSFKVKGGGTFEVKNGTVTKADATMKMRERGPSAGHVLHVKW